MPYNDDAIRQIRERIDIVELIGQYVQLKKAGSDYKGLSPFRTERTPSFHVWPKTQTWRDFGLNVQRSAANRPWMACIGNHEAELDNGPEGYAAFNTRYLVPSNGRDTQGASIRSASATTMTTNASLRRMRTVKRTPPEVCGNL